MENIISSLLGRYEGGSLSRRELIQGLVMLAAASGTAVAQAKPAGFSASTINHVSIQVKDMQKSAEFYMRVLGLPKRQAGNPNQAIRVGVGPSHLTLRQADVFPLVDHVCLGVDHFNRDAVVKDLKARGVTPEADEKGFAGFHIKDPDGFQIQLEDSSAF
jgi:catechol 2,3-dioxygenase-like lactoylglutathione lyase family enzyme